jgi:multiple sugar transport system permease protein
VRRPEQNHGSLFPRTLGAQFWEAFGSTFYLTIVTVALKTVIEFWMALIMSRAFRGRSLLRASVLIPWAISTAVTATLWFFIFAFQGVINEASGNAIIWTESEGPALSAIIIADVSKTTPFMALLIFAGLQIIPGDIYEAAKMDGASTWQRSRHVTCRSCARHSWSRFCFAPFMRCVYMTCRRS